MSALNVKPPLQAFFSKIRFILPAASLLLLKIHCASAYGQVQIPTGSFFDIGDNSGFSLVISGDGRRVVSGANSQDVPGADFGGRVAVFDWDGLAWPGTGTWSVLGDFINGTEPFERWGMALDSDYGGNRIIIGAPLYSSSRGRMSIWSWEGSSWEMTGNFFVGDQPDREAGVSVAISGDGEVIAYNHERQLIKVFRWNGVVWNQVGADFEGQGRATIYDSDPRALYYVPRVDGRQVSLSYDGSRIAIAGREDNKVNVYDWTGTQWISVGNSINASPGNVALSSDGDWLAIPKFNSHTFVQVLRLSGGNWAVVDEIPPEENDLPISIDISTNGSRVVIGYPFQNQGKARLWELNQNTYSLLADLNPNATTDDYGHTVSISDAGNRVAVNSELDKTFVFDVTKFAIGGHATGITGGSVELLSNLGESLELQSNGLFQFSQAVLNGNDYEVIISAQNFLDGRPCQITNEIGTVMGSAVSDISVVCDDPQEIFYSGFDF